MLRHLVSFFFFLWLPAWMHDRTPDEQHFYRRFFTAKHRARKALARQIWLGVSVFLLLFPNPALVVTLLLFTTFITFSLLDESD